MGHTDSLSKYFYSQKWSYRSNKLLRYSWFEEDFSFLIGINGNFSYFLVPETMSPLHVWSKVCMAPFHVRSKVCIAPFYVPSKDCKFAPHLERSNADFALHMEGSHADFAPHMERRHSVWDQQIAKIAMYAIFFVNIFSFKPCRYILGIYIISVTTFEHKNILMESTFNSIINKED